MRRIWFVLLVLVSAWSAARAGAADIIASSSPRRPVAATHGPATSPVDSGVVQASVFVPAVPAASLDRPRVIRGASGTAGELIPVPPSRIDSLSRVPIQPVLRPETIAAPRSLAVEDSPSNFAVERVALFGIEPAFLSSLASAEQIQTMPSSASASRGLDAPSVVEFDGSMDDGPPPFRFYGGVEYLMWWTKDADIPPLVTTTTNPNPPPPMMGQAPNDFGVLGAGTTRVLVGDDLSRDLQNGVRFRLGWWLPTSKPMAIEGSLFFLGKRSDQSTIFSDGNQLLARPFFNGNQGFEDVQVLAGPGFGPGMIRIDAPSSFSGGDLNLRCPICCTSGCTGSLKFDALLGYRTLRLREGLYITEAGTGAAGTAFAGQSFRFDDRFDTQNSFNGGQLGGVLEWRRNRWSVEARSTIALGATHQVIGINGSAIVTTPGGATRISRGALLALPSNIGRFERNQFSVVSEAGLTIGYQVTDWMRATAGYNFLCWNNVVRPGDQIDRVLDITQIPEFGVTPLGNGLFRAPNGQIIRALNPTRPVVPFKDTSYWAQGLTLGLQFSY